MKIEKKGAISFCAILFFLFLNMMPIQSIMGQTPEVLETGSLKEQFDYLHERTNIYNNFRAIREDMFQRIRRNANDSLADAFRQVAVLKQEVQVLTARVDSLFALQTRTTQERDLAIQERDSFTLLGWQMQKVFYNLLLWSVIGGLLVLLILGWLIFSRNRSITVQTTRDLDDLKVEFEAYRKSSRERFEQQAIDHFNELKRLKGRG